MPHSKLKILLFISLGLMLLFTPFLLDISHDGKAYAWMSRSANNGSKGDGSNSTGGYTLVGDPSNDQPPIHPTPEPATLLLFGAGAVSLAALRKKFRKK